MHRKILLTQTRKMNHHLSVTHSREMKQLVELTQQIIETKNEINPDTYLYQQI